MRSQADMTRNGQRQQSPRKIVNKEGEEWTELTRCADLSGDFFLPALAGESGRTVILVGEALDCLSPTLPRCTRPVGDRVS